MQMQAGAFRGEVAKENKARVVVTIELSGEGFKFTEKNGVFHDVLDLSVLSVDAAGKPTGKNQKVNLDLKPRTHQLLAATGFRVLSELEVPPGRWQFRVAGRSETSGATGSVFYDLDVPDFEKDALSLSGLVITSAAAAMVPTAGTAPMVKEVLPGPPTANRAFYPFDTLALFMEVYEGEKVAHTLDVTTTLTAADGNVAYRVNDERPTATAKGGAIVHTAQIPLKDIPPGIYTLRVAVTSRLGKKPPRADRALLIQVMPTPPGAPGGAQAPSPAPAAPPPAPSPAPSPSV
jgi:hypothetical protein